MYCGNCGSELDSSVNFCSVCGYRQNNIFNTSVNDENENNKKGKKSVRTPVIIGVLVIMVLILSVTVFKPQNRFRRYLEDEYDYVCLTDYCEYTSQTKDDEEIAFAVKERANELVDEFGISFEDLEW